MTRKTQENSPVADFEKSLHELEQLVNQMESGSLSLDEALKAYERGVSLHQRCKEALDSAALRVRTLSGNDTSRDEATPPARTGNFDDDDLPF